mgnify:CR=1 FL=1
MACHEHPPGEETHCVGWLMNQLGTQYLDETDQSALVSSFQQAGEPRIKELSDLIAAAPDFQIGILERRVAQAVAERVERLALEVHIGPAVADVVVEHGRQLLDRRGEVPQGGVAHEHVELAGRDVGDEAGAVFAEICAASSRRRVSSTCALVGSSTASSRPPVASCSGPAT